MGLFLEILNFVTKQSFSTIDDSENVYLLSIMCKNDVMALIFVFMCNYIHVQFFYP